MFQNEQLIAALERLDPGDREVLDLSLRRRVPDSALAEVLRIEPGDVARRRAAAIDRLADNLGVQRGEDLGHMLKALLEPDTWAALEQAEEPAGPEPTGPPEGGEVVAFAAEPEPEAPDEPPLSVPDADAETGAETEPAAEPVAVAAPPKNGTGASKPVLEMLAQPEERALPERRGSRIAAWILAGVLGGAALIAAGALIGKSFGDDNGGSSGGDRASATQHFSPKEGGPLAAPFPDPKAASCGYLTALVRRPVVLYKKPGGRRSVKLSKRTEWRSPRILSVVEQRGPWVSVLAPELPNGTVGWVLKNKVRLSSVNWSIHADVSKRKVFIRRDCHTVKQGNIAVGRPTNPTPTGRFAVTDRLDVVAKGSPYGCCVLALTGHQRKLPPGWPGGDRLAIHATTDTASIGKPVSLGCMRANSALARWLIKRVPLGTPVFITT